MLRALRPCTCASCACKGMQCVLWDVCVGRDVEYFMYSARDHEELCAARLLCAWAFVVCGNTSNVCTGFYHALMKRVKHVMCVRACDVMCKSAWHTSTFARCVCTGTNFI